MNLSVFGTLQTNKQTSQQAMELSKNLMKVLLVFVYIHFIIFSSIGALVIQMSVGPLVDIILLFLDNFAF